MKALALVALTTSVLATSAHAVGTAGTSVQMDIDDPALKTVKSDIAEFVADPDTTVSNAKSGGDSGAEKGGKGKALGLTEDYGLGNNEDNTTTNNGHEVGKGKSK